MLSINENDLQPKQNQKGKRTFRSLKMNGNEIEFSDASLNFIQKVCRDLAGRGLD